MLDTGDRSIDRQKWPLTYLVDESIQSCTFSLFPNKHIALENVQEEEGVVGQAMAKVAETYDSLVENPSADVWLGELVIYNKQTI